MAPFTKLYVHCRIGLPLLILLSPRSSGDPNGFSNQYPPRPFRVLGRTFAIARISAVLGFPDREFIGGFGGIKANRRRFPD